MTATVTRLGQTNEPSKQEVINALHEAISDVESGTLPVEKCLLLFLDETDDQFSARYINAGMKSSEAITLLECTKAIMPNQMCYIPDPCVCDG